MNNVTTWITIQVKDIRPGDALFFRGGGPLLILSVQREERVSWKLPFITMTTLSLGKIHSEKRTADSTLMLACHLRLPIIL